MRPIGLKFKITMAIFFSQCVLSLLAGSASAHRVIVFAWVEGDTVFVESKFAGGKKVKAGKVAVVDAQGVELLSGRTNDQGEFSFKVAEPADLNIRVAAGQGHQGEWTVHAAELGDMPSQTASGNSTANAPRPDRNDAMVQKSENGSTVVPGMVIAPTELEAVIGSILDKKLKPITRMLAQMRQKGPTAGEIFAGIGYIFGLVGVAAYVHSRKKKE